MRGARPGPFARLPTVAGGGARALIDSVVDAGTFEHWDEPIDRAGYHAKYLAELKRAETRAGTDEVVFTGRASVRRHAAALVVSEFDRPGGPSPADPARRRHPQVGAAWAQGGEHRRLSASSSPRRKQRIAAMDMRTPLLLDHRDPTVIRQLGSYQLG
jgi:hypothetical protein